ncbi:hypothetical protein [Actinomadura madurae]|uniref:hypothetical protein n=1 Tax=Actinomadura madurae TaxID=1993 RepID=UPI0020D256F2|nr:hypothetical protein [Actinomadura madurae]MCP9978147.1 hypothetical protein [Actinomadura madurae]
MYSTARSRSAVNSWTNPVIPCPSSAIRSTRPYDSASLTEPEMRSPESTTAATVGTRINTMSR